METANKIDGTPLMQAVINGHETTAKLLLEKGANPNAQDKDGLTSLFIAIRRHQTSLVRILIDHGADIDVKSNDGMNPLYYAIRQRHKDSVRLLVDRGADTSKINKLAPPLQYAKDLIADEDAAGNPEVDGVGQVAILKSIVKILEKSMKQGKTVKCGKHASTKSTRHAN
ncbi:hypothetical protein CcaCcLH18_08231 [Colletotrichum camelliae]|nr:hypothetical protein CcaCcLH18_08231 [Colletotrichum camelliae]